MRSPRRLLIACLGLCVVAQVLTSGVSAQTDEIDRLRSDREQVRADRTRAAADLDPLFAANDRIEEALALLDEDVAARQAALDATRSRLEAARIEVIAAQDEVVQQQQQIADLRAQLQRQAINAYVQPRGGDGVSEEVLSSTDLNEGERRRALISAVNTTQADILDELRIAEANRELAVAKAEAATRDIEARQILAAEQLAEVNDAIQSQQRLQQILDDRIAEFQAEVDAHAADEDALTATITGLIAEEEARQEAIREAARIEAERQRVAAEQEALRLQRIADLAAGRVPAEETVDRASAALVDAPAVATGSLIWPVSGTVTSNFGPRWGRQHNGIDIAANTGTPVISAGPGRVIAAGPSGGFGNLVLVDHGGGLVTAYAHLNVVNVSSGQQVSGGSSIGTVGCTGSCTGPHLHFETRVSGVAYDPYSYLA